MQDVMGQTPEQLLNAQITNDGIKFAKVTPPGMPTNFKPLGEHIKERNEMNRYGCHLTDDEIKRRELNFGLEKFTDQNFLIKTKDFLDGHYPTAESRAEALTKINHSIVCEDGIDCMTRFRSIHAWFGLGRFDRVALEMIRLPDEIREHLFWDRMMFGVQTVIEAFANRKVETRQKAVWEPDDGDGWFEGFKN
jgi:hypothetical protein